MLYPPRVALISWSPSTATGGVYHRGELFHSTSMVFMVGSEHFNPTSMWITHFPQILPSPLNWPFQHHDGPPLIHNLQFTALLDTFLKYSSFYELHYLLFPFSFFSFFLFQECINHYHYCIDWDLHGLAMIHWASSSNSLSPSSTSSLPFLLQEFFVDQIGYTLACSPRS